MALNARKAQLLEQRKSFGKTATKIKVLTPNSLGSSASTIARKTVDAELQGKIDQINAGEISSEDFLSYLKTNVSNPLFTISEQTDIQDKIRTFQKKVDLTKLEAQYQNTAPNTYDRVLAARNIAGYYQKEASLAQTGTPAQSEYLSKVGQWSNTANTDEQQILTTARKEQRAKLFYEVSQSVEPNTVEELQARSQAYQQLSEQAVADGDQTDAYKYGTYAQNELDKIPILEERQFKANEAVARTERLNNFRIIQDNYHDGAITLEEAARQVKVINDEALQTGDTALVSSVNSFSDKLQQDFDHGVVVGDIEGLPTVKRGTNGATTTVREMRKVFRLEDDNYSKAKKQIMKEPDVTVRLSMLTSLQAAYLYGAAPSVAFPDGFEGLTQRESFWGQMADAYPQSNADYANQVRDAQTKSDSLSSELQVNATNVESLYPGVDPTAFAQMILQDTLNPPAEGLDLQRPAGSQNLGIMVKYDQTGAPYEKLVPLNAQYTDPDTGEVINTMIGTGVGKVNDNGVTKYVKLTPYFADADAMSMNMPTFYEGEFNGELYVSDPMSFPGETKKAKDLAGQDPQSNYAQWYDKNKQREQAMITPEGQTIPSGTVSPGPAPVAQKIVSPIPEKDILPSGTGVIQPPVKVAPMSKYSVPQPESFYNLAGQPQLSGEKLTNLPPVDLSPVVKSAQPFIDLQTKGYTQPITDTNRLQVAGQQPASAVNKLPPGSINLSQNLAPSIPTQQPSDYRNMNLFQAWGQQLQPVAEKVKQAGSTLFNKLKFW